MSEELKWVVTADDKDIIAAFKRMQKELENAKQKMKEVGDAGEKAGKKQASAVDSSIASLGKMAAGWVSVQAAIQLANAEYQNYLDRQKEAAKETISTADAQIKFLRNLGRVSAEESKRVQADIKGIAAAVNQPVKNIYTAATEAISAQGNLSRAQMLENVKMSFRLAPESTAEATAIAGALGDVSSLTGSGNAAENAGLILGMGEQTRIPNMQTVAKNLVPGAIGVKGSGGTTSDAAALVSTLTLAMKDREGATSGTAAIQLAAQLDKYTGKGDPLDQIRKLQNNPAARDAFLKKASFEAKAQIPIRDLLTGGSATAALFDANRAKVPTGQRAIDQTNEFIANLEAAPEQQVAAVGRAFGARESQLQLGNQGGATAAVNREGLQKLLKASGAGWLEQASSGAMFEFNRMAGGMSGNEAAADILDDRAHTMRTDRDTFNQKIDEGSLKLLEQMVRELRGLRGDQKGKKNVNQHAER